MIAITEQERLDLNSYARQKALHSFLVASRVATGRKDREPTRTEINVPEEAKGFCAAIQLAVDVIPI